MERLIEAWFRGPMLDNWPWVVGAVPLLILAYVVHREVVRIEESERGREEDLDDEQWLA